MKCILCPVDFSKASFSAAEYASGLSVTLGAHLLLAHFYDVPALYSEAPLTAVKDAVAQLKQQSEKKLLKESKRLKKSFPSLRIDIRPMAGVAAIGIADLAQKESVDLIVMGTTGTGRLQRLLMGSTAASVLREAPCAVLTVPSRSTFKGINHVAYATDLKEDNLRAASALVPFFGSFDAEISFVFVDDKNLLHSEESVQRITRRIRSRVRYKKISGYISSHTDVTKGLQLFAKRYKCDMLVVFKHPRSFPETLFHESITRLTARQAELPVLSVRSTDRPL